MLDFSDNPPIVDFFKLFVWYTNQCFFERRVQRLYNVSINDWAFNQGTLDNQAPSCVAIFSSKPISYEKAKLYLESIDELPLVTLMKNAGVLHIILNEGRQANTFHTNIRVNINIVKELTIKNLHNSFKEFLLNKGIGFIPGQEYKVLKIKNGSEVYFLNIHNPSQSVKLSNLEYNLLVEEWRASLPPHYPRDRRPAAVPTSHPARVEREVLPPAYRDNLLTCPLSGRVFEDPITLNGVNYDREGLRAWVQYNLNRMPAFITREGFFIVPTGDIEETWPMTAIDTMPTNHLLKALIITLRTAQIPPSPRAHPVGRPAQG